MESGLRRESPGFSRGEDVNLHTCDPPGLNTRRLIVRAHRVPYDDAARTAERQVDVKGMAAWLGIATILTLTLMTALHPTA